MTDREGTISLARRRAEKTRDSKEWSVRDALECAIEDLDAGNINPENIAIHYLEPTKTGAKEHGYYLAGLSYSEHIALLHVALDRTLKDWQVD